MSDLINPIRRTNEELLGLVGAYAKEHHRSKYDQTLAKVAEPLVFRAYLLRLVEIRCGEQPAFFLEVPLSVLQETALVRRFRVTSSDRVFVVGGAKATAQEDVPHLTWAMLAQPEPDFLRLIKAIDILDLELVP